MSKLYEPRTCKRGHIVSGENAKVKSRSPLYLACRKCEGITQKQRRDLRKSVRAAT